MKKVIIGVAVAAVVVLVVYASLNTHSEHGTAVTIEKAATRTISSRVKATGEITPKNKVEISAKVVGEITDLPVKEGDRVRQGQVLVQIEPDLYEAARDQAKAALEQAKVSVKRVQVQLEDTDRTLKRTNDLLAQGMASQQQMDAAQVAYDTACVELKAQQHSVEQYASALKRAQDDLERTTIRSPMDGVVIQLNAERGETVVPGSTNLPGSVIMTVADMSRILAEVEVGEVDIVHVKLGLPTDVHVDALANKVEKGHVVEIATSGVKDASQGVIRFTVKIALDNPDPSLRPAMTAKVDIITATHENVVAVPIQAVVKRKLDAEGHEVRGAKAREIKQRDVVYLMEKGKARVRGVTTGISDDLFVEISDGLKTGDPVITGPYRTLKTLHDSDAVHEDKKKSEESEASEDSQVGVEVD
ncbi:MAG: efflux RND transporter periplasmic adaptor subunit [Acidobacteria bacterium]|jgi:HlyD family secretion protein|nr:efflux RND transporter periplasmic adaptor subunit [Acidobacteriota bacterium]